MKAEDLRINSLYYSVRWRQPVKCTLSDFAQLDYMCHGAELDSEIIAEMFEPIELTEEWLIKFGAFKHELKGQYGYKYFFPMLDYIYVIERDFNKHQSHFFGIQYTDCEGIEDQVFNFSFDLKYVHQLQNLYFALTGNELTIKE